MIIRAFKAANQSLSESFTRLIGLSNHPFHISSSFQHFLTNIRNHLSQNVGPEPRMVLDIGCGQFSVLSNFDKTDFNYKLFAMDISDAELRYNPFIDESIVYDACNPNYARDLLAYKNKFDLIVSHTFLEHVQNPDVTHRLIHFLLKDTGIAMHRYPTLYDPLLWGAHLLPDSLSKSILFFLEPFRKKGGKFRTYYKECRGFSPGLKNKYRSWGFEAVSATNYFGSLYLKSIAPLSILLDLFYFIALHLKLNLFCSISCIILKKYRQ